MNERIREHLISVYGTEEADRVTAELALRLERFRIAHPEFSADSRRAASQLSQRDVVLITYGDQITEPGVAPLRTLGEVLNERIGGLINTVHILPFYPYTSDDGFSVVDYTAVNPDFGSWDDVERMGATFRLMFDAVINHMSHASEWFQAYLRDEAPYRGYFIAVDPSEDLSSVVRPRTTPLLTPFEAEDGVRHVWTTFSADQVDLNFANTDLLLEIVDVLLHYVSMGARLIRLDAIAFMWKDIGTNCLHLPQTHALIKLMRSLLDEVAPDVLLVTETNVPHADNVSYFGDGYDEAQMVYNFTLPPLTLHAFHSGDASLLTEWARTLETPSKETAFFNFMASHDGVGLRPVEGILSAAQVRSLAQRTEAHGGSVSYRTNEDGSQSPYELNIVYYDALNDPSADEAQSTQVARFLCSQAILLSLAGVPGIYVHSLFGGRNWLAGVAETCRNRTINRHKYYRAELEAELDDEHSVAHQVFEGYRRLLECRTCEAAFHPSAPQRVLDSGPSLFALERISPAGNERVVCLHNVTLSEVTYAIQGASRAADLLSGRRWKADKYGLVTVDIEPYAVLWLRVE